MRVAAIGRHKVLYDSIKKVIDGGHEIVLIITCKESPNYTVVASDFKQLANKLDVDFIDTEKISSPEVVKLIKENKPDVAISVNWNRLVPQEIIELFPYGIINAHAGDLPRYRGNAAPNWAIINGEKKIVLTLHSMTPELDAGPILLQRKMPISVKTYIAEVYDFLHENFPEMFLKVIDGFASNSIRPRQQSKGRRLSLRCYPRIPKDGEIDWNQPAAKLARIVRAVSDPFDGAYTFIGTDKLIVWKAHYEDSKYPFSGISGQVAQRRLDTGEVAVITGKGFLVLEVVETKKEGRKPASEIIKTVRTRLGMDITGELAKMKEEIDRLKELLE